MHSYKITQSEKDQLAGQKMESGEYFNPVQDVNGDWFVFQVEHESCGLGTESEFVSPEPEELI